MHEEPATTATASPTGSSGTRTGIAPKAVSILQSFPTPLVRYVWPDSDALNGALRTLILEEEARSEGEKGSARGGWQSKRDFLSWTGEPGKGLVARMLELGNDATGLLLRQYGAQAKFSWRLEMWANVNRRGHYNRTHLHPGSTWSGVYYVDAGDPPTDGTDLGKIRFFTPVVAAAMSFFNQLIPPTLDVAPENGLMLLFPSYLPHFVHPNEGERPRISVAFNLRKDPYP